MIRAIKEKLSLPWLHTPTIELAHVEGTILVPRQIMQEHAKSDSIAIKISRYSCE